MVPRPSLSIDPPAKPSGGIQTLRDGVVFLGGKLLAPTVEAEVEQCRFFRFSANLIACQANGAMISCPGVVGVAAMKADVGQFLWSEMRGQRGLHRLCIGSYNQQQFALRYLLSQPDAYSRYLF